MQMTFKPWATPNYASLDLPLKTQEDNKQGLALHIIDIDADDLSQLCDTFRAEIFHKAGKPDPKLGKDSQ